MPDATAGDGSAKYGRDMVLYQKIAEAFRAIATGERDGHDGTR
jgi:hypothetical protein